VLGGKSFQATQANKIINIDLKKKSSADLTWIDLFHDL